MKSEVLFRMSEKCDLQPLDTDTKSPENRDMLLDISNPENELTVVKREFQELIPTQKTVKEETSYTESSIDVGNPTNVESNMTVQETLVISTSGSIDSTKASSIITTIGTALDLTTSTYIDTSLIPSVLGARNVMQDDDEGVIQITQPDPSLPAYLRLCPLDGKELSMTAAGSELFECRWMDCDHKCFTMDELVNHVNDRHVRLERPDMDYQCKWEGCPRKGKGFNARYKMLIHIRTHTNEKPHRCLVCGKCFSRLENLKIHNRSHTGEKPYICPIEGCSKAYSNSSDRFKHVRTHQTEKPYFCKMPGCNKRYTDPSSLRKHVRTHGHHYHGDLMSPSIDRNQTQILQASTVSRVINMPTNGMLGQQQQLTSQVFSLPGSYVPMSGLSNPLLSSAVLPQQVPTQTISTQTESMSTTLSSPESPAKIDFAVESSMTETEERCQDIPLDLTTGTIPLSQTDSNSDDANSTSTLKWCLLPVKEES